MLWFVAECEEAHRKRGDLQRRSCLIKNLRRYRQELGVTNDKAAWKALRDLRLKKFIRYRAMGDLPDPRVEITDAGWTYLNHALHGMPAELRPEVSDVA